MVENWRTEIFNYFDNRFTNAITESLNRVSKEISAQGRGYNFKVLRAKILYRNSAVKQAKFSYHKPVINRDFIDNNCDIVYERDGHRIIIEAMSVGSGVDIDELAKELSSHKTYIFQKVYESLRKEQNDKV